MSSKKPKIKKPGRDRRLYRRVIIVFLCAIILPSLIQAYLGLRSLRQEELRQEQLVLRSLKITLADAARKIEENVHGTILGILDSLDDKSSEDGQISPYPIHNFIAGNNFLEEAFLLDKRARLLYPRTFRIQNGSGASQPAMPELASAWLIRGEEAEAGSNYIEAINKYTTGLNFCEYTREKMAFRVRIARCSLKAGDAATAGQIYKRVIADDADHFYGEGMPYRVISSLQLVQILDMQGRPEEAFETLFGLYAGMLEHFDNFTQNQFFYFLSQVKDKLGKYLDFEGPEATARIDSLGRIEEAYMLEPVKRNQLLSTTIPSLEIALLTRPESKIIRYASIPLSADSSYLIAFTDLGYQSKGIRVIGARISKSQVLSSVEESLSGFDMGEELHLEMMEENQDSLKTEKAGIVPIAEEPLTLLSGTIKDHKLALIGMYGKSIKEFTARGIKSYYAIILSIIIVIALGVFFIFHDISREHELMQMKSEFISNVSHEIKTPISTIRSLAENVNEGWITAREKQQDYFRLIAQESERLGHLVENTLDFSRIESGSKRYYMENASLLDVIEKTLDRFRVISEGQDVEITFHYDDRIPVFNMDKLAIGQALLNLLDNAAKYSPVPKEITVKAFADGDYVKVSVTDKGIGIDKKDITKIFDKFYRSESGTGRKIAGSGIGLTLVKEIIQSHGGDITVESETGKGSTFTIRLPINQNS